MYAVTYLADISRVLTEIYLAKMIQRIYSWDTFVSQSLPPNDSGTVAVLDGCSLIFLFS